MFRRGGRDVVDQRLVSCEIVDFGFTLVHRLLVQALDERQAERFVALDRRWDDVLPDAAPAPRQEPQRTWVARLQLARAALRVELLTRLTKDPKAVLAETQMAPKRIAQRLWAHFASGEAVAPAALHLLEQEPPTLHPELSVERPDPRAVFRIVAFRLLLDFLEVEDPEDLAIPASLLPHAGAVRRQLNELPEESFRSLLLTREHRERLFPDPLHRRHDLLHDALRAASDDYRGGPDMPIDTERLELLVLAAWSDSSLVQRLLAPAPRRLEPERMIEVVVRRRSARDVFREGPERYAALAQELGGLLARRELAPLAFGMERGVEVAHGLDRALAEVHAIGGAQLVAILPDDEPLWAALGFVFDPRTRDSDLRRQLAAGVPVGLAEAFLGRRDDCALYASDRPAAPGVVFDVTAVRRFAPELQVEIGAPIAEGDRLEADVTATLRFAVTIEQPQLVRRVLPAQRG